MPLESDSPIQFFSESIAFDLPHADAISAWILSTCEAENKALESLNYIFCSDDHLLQINLDYLKHNTYTDIITFDLAEEDRIEGEIYISIDRIKDNSANLGTNFHDELHRVIIHGVLHLVGYGDKTDAEKHVMRGKEDYYLTLRPF